MVKILTKIFIISLFFVCSCIKITFIKGSKYENPKKFKLDLNTKPSVLISDLMNNQEYRIKENYFLTFYDVGCGFSDEQVSNFNKLYDLTKNNFEWIAITGNDSITEGKNRRLLNVESKYKYQTYYEIYGLKSSLRNLYYRNDIKLNCPCQLNIIIVNDSIVKIVRESINNNIKFEIQKNYLDSITNVLN